MNDENEVYNFIHSSLFPTCIYKENYSASYANGVLLDISVYSNPVSPEFFVSMF